MTDQPGAGGHRRDQREGRWKPRTQAIHRGTLERRHDAAIAPSIVPSVNFRAEYDQIGFSSLGTDEDASVYVYAREGHPNTRELELRLAALEHAEDAVVFSTGMAAISGLLVHLLVPGDHLLMSDVSYAGTAEFTRGFLRQRGIRVTVCDMSDLADLERSLEPRTKVVYVETPCNPILKLTDIAAVADLSHRTGGVLVVDSTLATPIVTKPLELGADFVVYSLTKYQGGHGDAMGGAVLGSGPALRGLRHEIGVHMGGTLSPFNAWLILRGLETLSIRMRACSDSAMAVASFLSAHGAVDRVTYPGLPAHPQFELAGRQMAMPGGMIAFQVAHPKAFGSALAGTTVIASAASLGSTRSLILYCDTADLQRTTFQLDEEHARRYRAWAGDGVFRLSIGLEDPDDLCEDLAHALQAIEVDID